MSACPPAAPGTGSFSPASLLYRSSATCPRSIAVQSETTTLTHGDLSDLIQGASVQGSHALPTISAGLTLKDLLNALQAIASGMPAISTDLQPIPPVPCSSPTCSSAERVAGFDEPALIRPVTSTEGVAWTMEALCYAWTVSSPAAGSIGVLAHPIGAPTGWGSLFGVLLGRGRVIIAGDPCDAGWAGRIRAGKLSLLDLDRSQLAMLIRRGESLGDVRQIRVWVQQPIPTAELEALQGLAPAANLLRVLATDAGPVSTASLSQLHQHGARWIGTPVFGTAWAQTESTRLVVAHSAFAPSRVDEASGWLRLGARRLETGLAIDPINRSLLERTTDHD